MSDHEWRDSDDDPEAVGYCQPPKRTQFKKGQSGNPKGRPRKPFKPYGESHVLEMMISELGRRVHVKSADGSGEAMEISQAIMRNFLSQAAKRPTAASTSFLLKAMLLTAKESERRQPEAHKLLAQLNAVNEVNPHAKFDAYAARQVAAAMRKTRKP